MKKATKIPEDTMRVGFRLGAFTIDLRARSLLRDGKAIALPVRAFDALVVLVTHRDRLVEKDEIVAAVWRDVAVTDDSLIHAVSVLRRRRRSRKNWAAGLAPVAVVPAREPRSVALR